MYFGVFENDIFSGYLGSYVGNPKDVDFDIGSGNLTGLGTYYPKANYT